MKYKINKIINNKLFPYIIICLFSVLSSLFLFKKGIIAGHDITYHLSRIKSIYENIKVGNFKSLIHNNLDDYGYANGIFYSNLFLYFSAILCFFKVNVVTSYKILVFLMTFFTGFSMYKCVYSVSKSRKSSILSALVYMLCPYRMCDVMARASLGEALAFIFVPIVILGLYELLFNDYKKWYVFSFGFVGLINCHLISTVFMILIIVLILFYYFVKLIKEPIRIKYFFISTLFGLILGAFFIFPMLEQYLTSELIINTSKSLEEIHTIPFTGLFFGMLRFTTRFVPGGIGVIFIYMLFCRFNYRSENDKISKFSDLCLSVGIIILLCSSDILPWPELSKTFLKSIQFSWRLFLFSSAFLSFAFGIVYTQYLKYKKKSNIFIIFIIIVASFSCILNQFLGFISLKKYYNLDSVPVIFEYNDFDFAAGEYMPIRTDWSLLYSDKREIRSNNDLLKADYKVKKDKYVIKFNNNTKDDTYIDIPVLYYKGYRAKSNITKEYYNISEGYNTWVRIYIGNLESDELILWYKGTKITRISYLISFITLIIFLLGKFFPNVFSKIIYSKICKKYKIYFISTIIPIFLMLLIYFMKNIYPFGNQTISNGDMGQAYLPAYYNLWDLLHNKTGLFYNFNIGNGSNIYDLGSIYGFFDPVDWLIAISNRNNIQYFINIILIIKVAIISLNSSIFFKKIFKKGKSFYIILFSVLNAMSGYIIIYHTNFPWLASVALFPIILLGLKKIFDGEKPTLYIVSLFFSLIFSFYISYMILLFILFSSSFALILFKEKEKRKKIIFQLGISTFVAIGLSSFAVLPVLYQTMNSYRFNIASQNQSSNFNFNNFINKLMVLCFYGLNFIFLIKYFINYKNYKKEALFFFIILFLTTISIVVEPINLLWHTGSYLDFPYRFAFIPTFIINFISLSYVNKDDSIKKIKSKVINLFLIFIIITMIFIYLIIMYFKYIKFAYISNPALGIDTQTAIWFIFGFIVSIIIYYFIFKINLTENLKKLFISIFLVIQILLNAYVYVGVHRENLMREYNDESSFFANEIYEFGKNDSKLYKYKDINNTMFENYPFISKKPSLSTWHMIDKEQRNVHATFGYATYGSKLLDKGGTIFSDQILGINRLITKNELKNDYNLIGKTKSYNIYEYSKSLPYGILYSNKNPTELDFTINKYENMNNVYKSLFGKNDNLFEKVQYEYSEDTDTDKYLININEKSYLYFDGTDIIGSIKEIRVNGEIFYLPFINSELGLNYNNTSGVINLGIFENEVVEIIMKKNDDTKYSPNFFAMSYYKIWNLVVQYKQEDVKFKFDKNKILINTHLEKNKSLFIPITYTNGFVASNNGKPVSIDKNFGNFMSIDLQMGENNVEIKFVPPLFKLSVIISIISLIIMFIFIKQFNNINNLNNLVLNITYFVYFSVVFIMIFYIYFSWIFKKI